MPTCIACENCREEYVCPACGLTGPEIAVARKQARASENRESSKE